MEAVPIEPLEPERFADVLDGEQHQAFLRALAQGRERLAGRTVHHVNSTAHGGGVAEMLQSLLGYLAGADIDARWLVIDGGDGFFEVTKRIHHLLHGEPGDGDDLDDAARRTLEEKLAPAAEDLRSRVRPGDVVVLHDPQPLPLAGAVRDAGATVLWTCHVGVDVPNDRSRAAWRFLLPDVERTDAQIFSRPAYAWDVLDGSTIEIISPCIDAFSPKNQALPAGAVDATLRTSGLIANGSRRTGDGDGDEPAFRRADGRPARVRRRADLLQEAPLTGEEPFVVQVSRWDPLKDPVGVLRAFAEFVPSSVEAHLVLAGPAPDAVADDPESDGVLAEVRSAWEGLPAPARARVHVATLPMEDLEENAAIVNALQRRAGVIVQKSLAEGFGLTVAEAMWKRRPTVGSRVGGIQDQIVDGESGLLVDDPRDLQAFAGAVTTVLEDGELAARLGERAHERVRHEFLPPRYLTRWLDVVTRVLDGRRVP